MLTKLHLARMALRGLYDRARHPLDLDRQNIADYARGFGLSEQAIHDFLSANPTCVLIMPPEQFSAYAVFAPVLEGLKVGTTFRIEACRGGMTDVMMRPIAAGAGGEGWHGPHERPRVAAGRVEGP